MPILFSGDFAARLPELRKSEIALGASGRPVEARTMSSESRLNDVNGSPCSKASMSFLCCNLAHLPGRHGHGSEAGIEENGKIQIIVSAMDMYSGTLSASLRHSLNAPKANVSLVQTTAVTSG